MHFIRKYNSLSCILAVCVLIETLSFTYLQQQGATYYYSSSILYVLSGIAVCLLPLIAVTEHKQPNIYVQYIRKNMAYIFCLFAISLLIYHLPILYQGFHTSPIDKHWADMLPYIQIGCKRLIAHQDVYAPIPEMGLNARLPYLPLMWMPFLPAEIFGFDYRWTTFCMQFIGILLLFSPILYRTENTPILPGIVGCVSIFLFLNYFLMKNPNYWLLTEEGVVAGYYILLAFALLRGNYWLIGLAITGCMLSRYSLVFWIPIYFGFVYMSRPTSDFWKLCISCALSISILFIFPFFIHDPIYFIQIPIHYTDFINRFWQELGIDAHQYLNVGLYKFFSYETAHTMNTWAIASSLLLPFILLLVIRWVKSICPINERYIAFASFKLSLLCFICFIPMPYQYIFVPVTIISYVVLFDYLRHGAKRGDTNYPHT